MEDNAYYTLGVWRVKDGQEAEFIAAWEAVGEAFMQLPNPPGPGTLLRSESDPTLYYSFGPWGSLEHIDSMRGDARAQAAIQSLVALCVEATPGTFRVVATAPGVELNP